MSVNAQTIENANADSVERMVESDPWWVDIGLARDKIGVLAQKKKTLLHAGPPIKWERASGPLRGAIIGAIVFEGWAENEDSAVALASEGEVSLECAHDHKSVGPMAGVISPSMPVFELEDRKYGARTYSNLNEGTGKVLRYGAYGNEVIERLGWMSKTFAPVLKASIDLLRKETGGLPIKPLIAQGLTMGDDCHNRYIATTSLFVRQIAPYMVRSGFDSKSLGEVTSFLKGNDFTMLNIGMAAAKAMTLAADGIEYSTIVTVLSRNGTDVGISVSSLGQKWFTAQAPVPRGVLFPGYSESDGNPDIGDSAITETAGFGGFAMAAAPAIVSWVGGSVQGALDVTNKMYEITFTKHKYFQIPYLGFKGTPTGIDLRKVLKTGIVPTINTGIAHKNAGIGQIGAGVVSFPMDAFKAAFSAYVDKYGL
jgi:hypothetical protein